MEWFLCVMVLWAIYRGWKLLRGVAKIVGDTDDLGHAYNHSISFGNEIMRSQIEREQREK